MHKPRTKRQQTIRAAIVYSVMTTLVLVGLAVAMMYVLGYRFDTKDRTLAQGGLIQLESSPNGARITVNNKELSATTPDRLDARAGSHTITLNRAGYEPWQKSITVEAGDVHWLNYALLIPKDPAENTISSFSTVESSLPADEANRLFIVESSQKNSFASIDLSEKAAVTRLVLPESLAPPAAGVFTPQGWSEDERYVLLSHAEGKKTRWYVIDTRDIERSIDVTKLAGASANLSRVSFVAESSHLLYALSEGSLRQINLRDKSMSNALIEGVASYTQSTKGVVSYVKNYDSKQKVREIGYYTSGAQRGRVIQTVHAGEKTTVAVAIGEYRGEQYIATQNDDSVMVERVKLHPSDSDASLEAEAVAVINTDETAFRLAFSPHDRFVIGQYGSTYMTYDIELDRFTTTTMRGDSAAETPLAWLNRYHVWSSRDSVLRMYEFDGENMATFGKVVPRLSPKLSKNNSTLYVFRKAENGKINLVRIALRI